VDGSTKLFLRNVEGVGVLDVDFNGGHVKMNGSVYSIFRMRGRREVREKNRLGD
jgi:hypothetical protein